MSQTLKLLLYLLLPPAFKIRSDTPDPRRRETPSLLGTVQEKAVKDEQNTFILAGFEFDFRIVYCG